MSGGKHRPGRVAQVPYERALSHHINAVDAQGNRYTTHAFASRDHWWWGATILTPITIDRLRSTGVLPLREVWVCPTADEATS